jgi:hypothetical protein
MLYSLGSKNNNIIIISTKISIKVNLLIQLLQFLNFS